jgi:hypothetical protein
MVRRTVKLTIFFDRQETAFKYTWCPIVQGSTTWWWQNLETLAVSKETNQKFDTENFNLKNLTEVEGKEQCQVEISNGSWALESLDDDVDINRAC